MARDLDRALARGLAFLQCSQLPHGEFVTCVSRSRDLRPYTRDSSAFTTASILYSLSSIEAPSAAEIRRKGLAFLIGEMEGVGVWRYWTSRSPKRIGPDLDDTCLISYLLRNQHPRIFFGSNLPTILANRNRAGLFYTWIRREGERNDVDSVVNANVLLFLGDREETAAVASYLSDLVLHDREEDSSWYYLDALSLYYALSRAFVHGASSLGTAVRAVVGKVIARQQADGGFGDDWNTACAVCTLLNCGHPPDGVLQRAIRQVLSRQGVSGAWSPVAAWTGPEPPEPHAEWWGSAELTTALSLEALARYRALVRAERARPFAHSL